MKEPKFINLVTDAAFDAQGWSGDVTLPVPRGGVTGFGTSTQDAPSAETIRALVCGYPSRYRRRKLMAVLQAFFDESGSEKGDRRLFVAGYINYSDVWEHFSDAWDAALREAPGIEYMHMVEAHNLRGPFKNWSKPKRDRKVLRMSRLIREFEPWSLNISVSSADFDSTVGKVAPYGLANPYFACLYGSMIAVARLHAQAQLDVAVDFIFDDQSMASSDIIELYPILKRNLPNGWGDLLGAVPVFRSDRKIVALQAADMLAWHIRRDSEGTDHPYHQALANLTSGQLHTSVDFDKDRLADLARQIRWVSGVRRVRAKKPWKAARKGAALNPKPANIGRVRMWLMYARGEIASVLSEGAIKRRLRALIR